MQKQYIKQSVAQQIINTIKSKDPHKMSIWNVTNLISSGNSLSFDIRHNFIGEVVIVLNIKTNKYMITFNKYMNNRKKKIEMFDNLDLSDIVTIIDNFIKEER